LRQACKALVLEDLVDGDGAECDVVLGQGPADVIDGEILLAESDDPGTDRVGFGCGVWSFGRRQEEGSPGILAELVDQDAEASRRVSEAFGDLGARESLDEEGAEGFVLALSGVGGFEEDAGEVR
jgi:hypothetical protein